MPGLVPPVIPSAAVDFAKEIREAAKSTLEADPNTAIDGNQGVKTIEIWYPQPNGGLRAFGRNALPSISLRAHLAGATWIASNNRQFDYDLFVGIVVENANTRTGEDDTEQLREIALVTLLHNITEQTNTWLSSGNPVLSNGSYDPGEVEQLEEWPHRFASISTIPLRVIYRIAELGS